MTRIIVDSTCDLPKEIMEEYGIGVLPLRVCIGDKEYRDGIDISVDEVYDTIRKGIVPKTAQASLEDIRKAFLCCVKSNENFIYLAFSSAMSGTCNAARLVMNEIKKEYKDIKMAVIDTKSGSGATGLIALQAARLVAAGKDFNFILKQVSFLVKHVEHVFSMSDLAWLSKGGRISSVSAFAGNVLNIRPILDVQDGYIKVIGKVRGRRKMVKEILNQVYKRIADFPEQVICIAVSEDPSFVDDILPSLKSTLLGAEFIKIKIGSVLATHLGLSGVGIMFFNKPPEVYYK